MRLYIHDFPLITLIMLFYPIQMKVEKGFIMPSFGHKNNGTWIQDFRILCTK